MKAFRFDTHDFFGSYLEINPLGREKVCSFDCGYCNLGPSKTKLSDLKKYDGFPAVSELVSEFGSLLADSLVGHTKTFETVMISGNGEPTLYPWFGDLVSGLIDKRQELMANNVRLVCFTNGDTLSDSSVTLALNKLDQVYLKLDYGNERAFKKFNRPRTRTTLEKVILGAKSLENLSIQTTVIAGESGIESASRLDDWLEVIAMLKPNDVVLTAAQAPFRDPAQPIAGIEPATEDDLHRLSHWLDRRLKIKARVDSSNAA